MHIDIPYGQGTVPLDVDDDRIIGVIGMNEVDVGDESTTLRRAFDNPLKSPGLAEFLEGARDVLFIVNDGTRPTPTARILDFIKDEIAAIPEPSFIIATGSHRAANPAELKRIFGDAFLEKYSSQITSHDAKADETVQVGVTSYNTPARFNRKIIDASRIVAINSVEPHYFGGFTGGRKSFLPGVAAYETIEKNHSLAMKPGVAPMALDKNPVHRDMMECVRFISDKPIFSIQVVPSRDDRIYAAYTGNLHETFFEAAAKARDVFAVPVREKADIVVSVAPFPMDANFLQVQKAFNNAKSGLKDDGLLILVGRCDEGPGGSYYELLKDIRDPHRVMKVASSFYKLGSHIAYNMAKMAISGGIFMVSEMPEDMVIDMFMTPVPSVQFGVDRAFKVKGPSARLLVLPYGSLTVPYVL